MKQNCYRKTRPLWVRFLLLLVFLVHWSCSDDKDFEGNPGPGTGEVPEETRYLPLIEINTSETIVDEPKVRSNMKITVDEEEIAFDPAALSEEKIALNIFCLFDSGQMGQIGHRASQLVRFAAARSNS